MEIRIHKTSDVPLRQQLAEQILLLVVTGKLKPGSLVPSVRELARRLKIHHNTVSEAYQDLVRRKWLVRRRGSHLMVRGLQDGLPVQAPVDLDDIINEAVRRAREEGYTLQALRRRVREILSEEPPDHILVVAQEPGLRLLLQREIQDALSWPVEGCSQGDLANNRGLAIGAQVATPAFALTEVEPLVSKQRPLIPLEFGTPDHLFKEIDQLREPSVIVVVSASNVCLRAADGVLAPVIGDRHSLAKFLWPLEDPAALAGADLILCDSLAIHAVKKKPCVLYRLIDANSMNYLRTAMDSYQEK